MAPDKSQRKNFYFRAYIKDLIFRDLQNFTKYL